MKVKYLAEHTPDYEERMDWGKWLKELKVYQEAIERIPINWYVPPNNFRAEVWVPEPEVPQQEGQEGIPDYPPNPQEEPVRQVQMIRNQWGDWREVPVIRFDAFAN